MRAPEAQFSRVPHSVYLKPAEGSWGHRRSEARRPNRRDLRDHLQAAFLCFC